MLIARAVPVMHAYTKPRGGQKAYKGHVITLPQDVQQLADVLPRCPQELPVIVFTIAGKDNKSQDFLVRRQKVADALYWLTGTNENGEPNNHLYQNITIDNERLKVLPENNTLSTIPKIDLAENTDSDEDQVLVNIDVGPVDPDDNERVYNGESEMSSFLPTNFKRKKEKNTIDENFLHNTVKRNWNVGSEPLNEFSIQYLASMSFPSIPRWQRRSNQLQKCYYLQY